MKLLVTGAGRCGTWWLTHALRSCGIPATHEVAYDHQHHGEGEWACEVSWLAAPYTPLDDAHVVHLVRHPLDQIASRAAWGSFEPDDPPGRYDPRIKGAWAVDQVPAIAAGRSPVERAAIHWARWNELITADELIRLEDLDAATVWRLARIVDPAAREPTLPGKANASTRRKPTVTWADIDHVPGLVDLAALYRYREVPCES